jgi:thioredoxin 1
LSVRRIFFPVWIVLSVFLSLLLFGVAACSRGPVNTVVAEVNGQRITVQDIHTALRGMSEDMRVVYEQRPDELLDQLISLTLLLQEAKRKGLVDSADLQGFNRPDVQAGIRRLVEMEARGTVKVTDKEVTAFYRQYRDQMQGKPLSDVREAIRNMLLEQKQQQVISNLVASLRANAAVRTYPERLPKPSVPPLEASKADAFQAALQSGHPTLVDFGSNRCIPCIRLRPVLRELKDAYGNRINVLFMEVDDQRDLALRYKVQLVPTLIFFDAQGREVQRKIGFMDRGAIEKVLHNLKFLEG